MPDEIAPVPPEENPVNKTDAKEPEILAEGEKDNCYYKIVVSTDRLNAFLSLVAYDERDITTKDILSLLEGEGINYGIRLEALAGEVNNFARNRRRIVDFLIAEGEPPTNGEPGRLDFQVAPSSGKARYRKKEDGSIDYQELNLFTNVVAGQELAELIPPTQGIAGRNVFGEVMPGEPGQEFHATAGLGVKAEKNGRLFVSTLDGYLVYENNVLAISDVYQVSGDIDYSSGNINFVGKVIVTGDVLDDFKIIARKGIEVEGMVGASYLESEGDIVIRGGIAGKDKAKIRSQKGVTARYVNEATIEAIEDVTVQREILNATVKTQGVIRSEQSRIVGGDLVAQAGLVAGSLGSDLGIQTNITVGVDYLIQDKMAEMEAQIEQVDKTISKISQTVGPIISDRMKLERLSTEKKQVVRTLIEQLKTLKSQRQVLSDKKDEYRRESSRKTGKKINVVQRMFQGVTIMIGTCRLVVKESTKGPFSLVEDVENEMVRIVPMSSL